MLVSTHAPLRSATGERFSQFRMTSRVVETYGQAIEPIIQSRMMACDQVGQIVPAACQASPVRAEFLREVGGEFADVMQMGN